MTEAKGYKLFLSGRRSGSGYKGVLQLPSGRYSAERFPGTARFRALGFFDSAVEAAVAYAASVAETQANEAVEPRVELEPAE